MRTETYSTEAPECPYCGHKHQHDGGHFYDEDLTEYQCEACDKTFDMEVYTSTSWTCTARWHLEEDDRPEWELRTGFREEDFE